jgi:hypothetical protein
LELALKFATLAEATDVYAAGAACEIRRTVVSSEPVTLFVDRLSDLERQVAHLRDDEYWSVGLGLFKRRRFFVQATPVNVSDPALELLAYEVRAREHFSTCRTLYPEHSDSVDAACEALMDLLMSRVDPLSDAVLGEYERADTDRVGVVLPTFGFEQIVQRHLRTTGDTDKIDVLTPRNLAMKRPYDMLFVVGAPVWYARKGWAWVYTAPRANDVVMVGYAQQVQRPLPSARAFTQSKSAVAPISDDGRVYADIDDTPEEGGVDWTFASGEAARRAIGASAADLVDARMYLLASGCATFLAASEESRVPTLEPDAPEDSRLVYVAPPDIGPGTVLLLRSEGGGDLVVAVADAILGTDAPPLRAMQERWKSRLRALVAERGVAQVVAELKKHGSNRANRSNLANWCSPRSLRTDDEQDFLAIMRTAGLEADAAKFWKAMGKLDRAHRRAGREIREQLEEQARKADLTALEEQGRADFSLPEGGGALTAFRVEEVSSDVVSVPYQHLGDPFEARA